VTLPYIHIYIGTEEKINDRLSEKIFSATMSETNNNMTVAGSSSVIPETLSSVSSDNIIAQEDTAEKQARKKQSRQSWKGPSKGDGKEAKVNKAVIATEDTNGNENGDERKKKDKKSSKNRTDGTDQPKNKDDVLDLNDNKQSQHQRRKSTTANTLDIPNKNKNSNNSNPNKSSHRRGMSMANVGELQSSASSKNAAGKSKSSKDDSENKSEALESLQQIIASLKNLPAVPPKPQKSDKKDGEENQTESISRHRRGESSIIGSGKRLPAAKQHKKNASVSFSFPLTSAVTSSLKGIPDSEDGKPMDIENALQDTISSLRRLSLDKGKAQKDKEVDKNYEEETEEEKKARRNKKNQNNRKSVNSDEITQSGDRKQELDSPKSPFDFKKNEEQQSQSAAKKSHRRHQSLGHALSPASTSAAIVKANIPTHTRRHSVALNGSRDILKEIEKSQSRPGTDAKGGHRRSNSRNFDGNWRSSKLYIVINSFLVGSKKKKKIFPLESVCQWLII
jgi:hypothetical protein